MKDWYWGTQNRKNTATLYLTKSIIANSDNCSKNLFIAIKTTLPGNLLLAWSIKRTLLL